MSSNDNNYTTIYHPDQNHPKRPTIQTKYLFKSRNTKDQTNSINQKYFSDENSVFNIFIVKSIAQNPDQTYILIQACGSLSTGSWYKATIKD